MLLDIKFENCVLYFNQACTCISHLASKRPMRLSALDAFTNTGSTYPITLKHIVICSNHFSTSKEKSPVPHAKRLLHSLYLHFLPSNKNNTSKVSLFTYIRVYNSLSLSLHFQPSTKNNTNKV